MMRVEAAGTTDTGQVRPANEDAYLVGDSVFAVADGMGGHLAGEVASATALEPIGDLDGRVFPEGPDAVTALREAVVSANERVSSMAADEPSYRGMGTTLTATMLEGRRLHIAHVGDSRAYLLRDGSFSQLTDDHTLVQHLVNEGQITQEEAASHPQRSIVTRAIGVSREVDVDSMTLDLEPGDQILLCSDGLTGVVEDRQIAEELADHPDTEDALQRLVALANAGGGPDNITVILLRVSGAEGAAGAGATDEAGGAGDDAEGIPADGTRADGRPVRVTTRDDGAGSEDWAGRLGAYGSLAKGTPLGEAGTDGEQHGRGGRRALAVLLAVVVLIALVAAGAWLLLSREYFLGLDGDRIAIYQGVDMRLGPIELARVVERTELTTDDVQPWFRERLEDGVPAAGLADARTIVDDAPRSDEAEDDEADGPAADGSGSTDAGS